MASGKTPIIYTMGKVGSMALYSAIKSAGIPAHHIHYLDRRILWNRSKQSLQKRQPPPRHIRSSAWLLMRGYRNPEKFLYVTAVRDPIARNLSAFFEILDLYPRNSFGSSDEAFAYFMQRYANVNIPFTWFDREFKERLDIDVFQYPFDHERRFIYVPEKSSLIFRADCPDATKSQVLSEILKRPVTVSKENEGSGKAYKDLYDEVKDIAKFPQRLIDKSYSSHLARHFWTPLEIDQMRARWSDGCASA